MSYTIRPATSDDAELQRFAAVVNEVTPENPTDLEELRWQDANYRGQRFVAEVGGEPVGVATTGQIYSYRPDFERWWVTVLVREAHRRQGIGSALLVAGSRAARAAEKTGLQTSVSERHADGLVFLQHRGFVEFDRYRMVELDISRIPKPDIGQPPGVEITTLGARPELVVGVHAVAEVAFPDIPHADEPIQAGSLEEFRKRDVDRTGIPPDAFHIALDAGTGEVIGYASLMRIPGRGDAAWHDMTAVAPAHRGRGIATALKRATIAWAIDAGMRVLETGNDVDNAPMRAVNASLGYRPIPDEVGMRGPLADEPAQ
jgi:GNAT superfamily N-acetyltransferase